MSETKAFELTKKEKNFSKWYDEVLFKAEILDERYPVKGMYAWLPYGYSTMERIMSIMEDLLRATGHKRVQFPSLTPESVLKKEFQFIKGFEESIFWITRLGSKKSDEPLALRPTSEAIMYEILSKRIKSYSDLPMKLYQISPVYRYETRATRPIFRVRELAFFKEAHTMHATPEEARDQVREGVDVYCRFYDSLLIPYLVLKTPRWGTFPGALYNFDLVVIMPDLKALELGSVINLGEAFAKAYEIKFMDEEGETKYVNQTVYGISERSLGAVIAIHGDDLGMRLPPRIAPTQVVLVPIPKKGLVQEILSHSRRVFDLLSEKYRVHLDDDMTKRPGYKFYKWDMRGVPLRVEVGSEEIEKGIITLVRRDNYQRISVQLEELERKVGELLESISEELKRQADEYFSNRLLHVESTEEIGEKVGKGLVSFAWCGSEECGHKVEEDAGVELLGFQEGALLGRGEHCLGCGEEARHLAWIGRTY